MHILVSNDDGYRAPGIQALAQAMRRFGRVTVVAPDHNHSGASNSLTLNRPLTVDNLDALKQVKEVERASLARYAELCKDAKYIPAKEYPKDQHPVWNVPCKLAFPSATQNEVSGADAANLIKNGCVLVCEGANMPSTPEAVEAFLQAGLAFGPGKCANAGGVSTSQLEMAQNASMQSWTFEEVDAKLKNIMANIFKAAHETAEEFGVPGNYVLGGNIAGFRKVADSMIEQGLY